MSRLRVLRVIDRLNVGGPALQASVLAAGLDPDRFEQRLLAGSVEPGIAYSFTKVNVFLSVPLTIYRQRWLSVDEENAGRVNAVSAAFADYNIIAGMSYRW